MKGLSLVIIFLICSKTFAQEMSFVSCKEKMIDILFDWSDSYDIKYIDGKNTSGGHLNKSIRNKIYLLRKEKKFSYPSGICRNGKGIYQWISDGKKTYLVTILFSRGARGELKISDIQLDGDKKNIEIYINDRKTNGELP